LRKAQTENVMRFSTPFSTWINQPSFQILTLLVGICYTYCVYLNIQNYENYVMHLTCFRLVGADRLLSLRFMYKGCSSVLFQAAASANRTWRLDSPLAADGFILTFPDTDVGGLPVPFSLQSSADAGVTWATVGAPEFRWTANGIRVLGGAAPLAARELRFDLRPPWPCLEQNVLEPAVIAAGLICAAAFGALRQSARAKAAVLCALWLLAAGSVAAAAGFAAAGAPREAFAPATAALAYAPLAALLRRSEPLFLDACAALGLLCIAAARLVADCAVFADCGNLAHAPPIGAALVAALAALYTVLRARSVAEALRGLRQLRGPCDAEWRRVLAQPGAVPALHELADLALRARRACAREPPPRQHNRLLPAGAGATVLAGDAPAAALPRLQGSAYFDEPAPPDSGDAATADLDRPVRSLDQLYAQARVERVRSRETAAVSALSVGKGEREREPRFGLALRAGRSGWLINGCEAQCERGMGLERF
jgi:hypothetical protein